MTRPTEDELEAMAVRQENARVTMINDDTSRQGTTERHRFLDRCAAMEDAAAMLRACKGQVRVKPTTWRVDESKYGTLIYSLKQDAWRKGEPVMVNDVTIRIENANGSTHDLKLVAARILAALEPAPGYLDGWNEAREEAAARIKSHTELAKLADFDSEYRGLADELSGDILALTPPERIKP